MKVLLDEMLPIGVRQLPPEHQVMTAAYVGLAGVSNGEMISRAISDGFDVIVSLDRGIPHQQNLDRYAATSSPATTSTASRLRRSTGTSSRLRSPLDSSTRQDSRSAR